MLKDIIFLFCEHVKMDMRNDKIRHIDKSLGWGETCYQLLN